MHRRHTNDVELTCPCDCVSIDINVDLVHDHMHVLEVWQTVGLTSRLYTGAHYVITAAAKGH